MKEILSIKWKRKGLVDIICVGLIKDIPFCVSTLKLRDRPSCKVCRVYTLLFFLIQEFEYAFPEYFKIVTLKYSFV